MAIEKLGPKELALRSQRTEIQRRYVPEDRISVGDAKKLVALERSVTTTRVEELEAEVARLKVAVRDQAGVELSEENDRLINEVERLKRQLAERSEATKLVARGVPTRARTAPCPVCAARKEANKARMRKARHG